MTLYRPLFTRFGSIASCLAKVLRMHDTGALTAYLEWRADAPGTKKITDPDVVPPEHTTQTVQGIYHQQVRWNLNEMWPLGAAFFLAWCGESVNDQRNCTSYGGAYGFFSRSDALYPGFPMGVKARRTSMRIPTHSLDSIFNSHSTDWT